MQIIPAIDLRGGRCVRLRQGDYTQETVFGDDPAAMAKRWVEQGARYLHLVDLDGAKEGEPLNLEAVRAIVQSAGVPCELGGGLRQESDLEAAFAVGVDRLVLGTQALKAPAWFAAMADQYAGRLVLGLDARDGYVATDGWLKVSQCRAATLARHVERLPLAALIYTDIGRDGMMSGPNLEALAELAEAIRLPVIASGGVASLDDIRRLAELPLAGIIVGRALYEGTLNLAEAIKVVGGASKVT